MITPEGQREYFELCLFSEEDTDKYMDEWLEDAEILGLDDEIVHKACAEHLPRMKSLEYKGVRMAIGGAFRELLDLFRYRRLRLDGKDVKSVYGVLPAILSPYQALKYAGGDDVYVGFPDMILMKNMQEMFHHAWHLFERAEQSGFSYGARHCALNKLGIAGRLTGIVPNPSVMWSWGLVCDEATKVDEYLKEVTDGDWASVVTRLPHDTYWPEEDYALPERVHYLAGSMKRGMEKCQEVMGITVTEKDAQQAVADFNRYMGKVGKLNMLNMKADPVPLMNSTLSVLSLPASIPFNTGLTYMEAAVDTLIEECQQAIAEGRGCAPKNAAKVGMYFNPSQNAWFDKLLIENGVVPVFSLPTTRSKAQMTPSKFTDTYDQMAEQWLKMNFGMGCGCDTRNWVEKVRMVNPDAMIVGFLDYDRWLGQIQKFGARVVEEETGVPTFYVEADFYDDRDYSEEALRSRIESIAQIITMKKTAKEAQALKAE